MTELETTTLDDLCRGFRVYRSSDGSRRMVQNDLFIGGAVPVPGVHLPNESLKIVSTLFEAIDQFGNYRQQAPIEAEYGVPSLAEEIESDAYALLVRIREMIVRAMTERDQLATELATVDRQSTTRLLAELSAARQQIREMRAGQA